MLSLLLLVIIVGAAWFWFESMKTKEVALSAAKAYCKQRGLQLLDDTVACKRLRLKIHRGKIYFSRLYHATVYDREQDKKTILPILLANRSLVRVGQQGEKVVSLNDYRQ